jgi:hypothetical protein
MRCCAKALCSSPRCAKRSRVLAAKVEKVKMRLLNVGLFMKSPAIDREKEKAIEHGLPRWLG